MAIVTTKEMFKKAYDGGLQSTTAGVLSFSKNPAMFSRSFWSETRLPLFYGISQLSSSQDLFKFSAQFLFQGKISPGSGTAVHSIVAFLFKKLCTTTIR